MIMTKRMKVYRFLGLSYLQRVRILLDLKLIRDEDQGKEHIDLLDEILDRAKEDGTLEIFWKKIDDIYLYG